LIIVYHIKGKVSSVEPVEKSIGILWKNKQAQKVLSELAAIHPTELLSWCSEEQRGQLDKVGFEKIFSHKLVMASYGPLEDIFHRQIGYVDQSPFVNISKNVRYPSWIMSSVIGGIYGSALHQLKGQVPLSGDFEYWLCSIAKLAQPKGLFTYSAPSLLRQNTFSISSQEYGVSFLFRFVRQHYKLRWVLLLLLNIWIYERKLHIRSFLKSLLYRKRKLQGDSILVLTVEPLLTQEISIDVIIPTIGRAAYLLDTLIDLAQQSLLPKSVIIIEQNPDEGSHSALPYLNDRSWPFAIKHVFTHDCGACRARNLGLSMVSASFVFFADDDIIIEPTYLEKGIKNLITYCVEAICLSCLQKGETQKQQSVSQTANFGTLSALVNSEAITNLKFHKGLEFGYGEDSDFGMQIRKSGGDIAFLPGVKGLHKKAPSGGFRTKFQHPWLKNVIQPKPSPTIMLYWQMNSSKTQLQGYKTFLFIKMLFSNGIKKPGKFFIELKERWKLSIYWAEKLRSL
jgi:GT2 family glycosyltransferase